MGLGLCYRTENEGNATIWMDIRHCYGNASTVSPVVLVLRIGFEDPYLSQVHIKIIWYQGGNGWRKE